MSEDNILYDRYCFYQRCQQSEETLRDFVADVRELSKACDFRQYTESLIRDRIVFGMQNEDIKWRIINSGGDPSVGDVMRAWNHHKQRLDAIVDEKVPTIEHYALPATVKMEMEDPSDTASGYALVDAFSGPEEVDNIKPEVRELAPYISCDPLRDNSGKNHRLTNTNATKFKYNKSNATHTSIRDLDRESGRHMACDICGQFFSTKEKLQRHRVTHNEGERYECFTCQRSFSTYSAAKSHSRYCLPAQDTKFVHQNSGMERLVSLGYMFTCKKCKRSYSRKNHYRRHVANHRGCQVCGIYVLNQLYLQRHMIEHIDSYAFECFVCHQRYTTYKQVRIHVSSLHIELQQKDANKKREPIVKNYACRQCDARFTCKFLLRRHLMRNDHQAGGKFCGKH